jgi:hypothetical protein
MKHAKEAVLLIAIASLAIGCARWTGGSVKQASHPTSVEELQDVNLEALYGMIQNLTGEIAAMKELPPTPYPLYEELRATDLAGLEARRELLMILRDHCTFSKELLVKAQKNPDQKARFLEEWEQHKERMRIMLDAADKKVNGLQRQRVRLEFELVERALQGK